MSKWVKSLLNPACIRTIVGGSREGNVGMLAGRLGPDRATWPKKKLKQWMEGRPQIQWGWQGERLLLLAVRLPEDESRRQAVRPELEAQLRAILAEDRGGRSPDRLRIYPAAFKSPRTQRGATAHGRHAGGRRARVQIAGGSQSQRSGTGSEAVEKDGRYQIVRTVVGGRTGTHGRAARDRDGGHAPPRRRSRPPPSGSKNSRTATASSS
ncbi:hypothetical protein OMP38_14120 [Cohnella ginsengisoli]|uniref:Uncharacterized protein n=1 Tax=Cohnella ginsengisoli TaxID=425004 RepID=A0A9X4QN12_9BACL|nr:hypothetical protein [Cohnella ginsengisoli]MDG0791872.1 hypothetical protein [Cohnella ginsengisoli]